MAGSGSKALAEVDGPRALPRLLVSGPLADRLGVRPTTVVTVSVAGATPGAGSAPANDTAPANDAAPTTPSPDGVADDWAQTPVAVPDIPAHRGPVEQNKALVHDALASRSLLHLLGAPPESASIYWRCAAPRCADAAGVAEVVAHTADLELAAPYRVDTHDELGPVLRQQREQGALFAWVSLALGSIAVAVVATAMVEVRTPELVTLRTLGATRAILFGAALLEGLVVAVAVGLVSVAASLVLARLDPDLFNHIDAIELERFTPPLGVYLRTGATTVAVGLLTGLLPAVRAYRLVRAH
jgi:putative ABC transport system permease protein